MIEVTSYKSNDGVLWPTRAAAERRDELVARCDAIRAILGARPDMPDGTYIQHSVGVVEAFHDAVVELVRHHIPSAFKGMPIENRKIHPQSIVGRYVSDSGIGPLDRLWWRLMCTDLATGREYEQPYFVAHPAEARPLPLSASVPRRAT